MKKITKNFNNKGQYHGYYEISFDNKKLWCRCTYKNDAVIGYGEYHTLNVTNFYIK